MSETTKNRGGRPRVNSTAITLRLVPDQIDTLDEWRRKQPDLPGRPEAIRRLIALALHDS